MPSSALTQWRADRLVRLTEIDAQCAATAALLPPNPNLADENLRGYVMLLSAHFQGFCRDLHTECIQFLTASIVPAMQVMFQSQCFTARDLDGSNPRYATLRKDFERFGFDLHAVLSVDPANQLRITYLDHLNAWRNYAAHQKTSVPLVGGPFALPALRTWKDSCEAFAAELDRVMYNQLHLLAGIPPW